MARIQAITVPKWGLTMTEGTVTEWRVNEGDTINIGDEIMDMETSKIVNVVESIVAGTLRRKVAKAGDTLPVAALMGVVAEADVTDAEIDDFIANYVIDESVSGAPTGEKKAAAPAPAPAPAAPAKSAETSAAAASGKIRALTVPKWGLTMTEGTVTEWLVNEGDTIAVGDPVMEMETSKIANVVESIVAGTLRRKVAKVGDTLPVAELMGVVADDDVTDAEIDDFIANYVIDESVSGAPTGEKKAAPSAPAPAAAATPAPAASGTSVPAALAEGSDDSAVHATVHARRLAAELGINLNKVTGTGRNDRISVADVERAIVDAGGSVAAKAVAVPGPEFKPVPADDSGVPATSVARRLAKSLGVNLHTCRPTGRHGKVCKYDVEAAHALTSGAPAPAAPTPEIAAQTAKTAPAVEAVPMSGMRRTIASRLQASKQTIPHYRVSMDINMDALLALRKQINNADPGVNISVNDGVVKAVAMTLVKMPEMNVQYDEASQTIQRFKDADISVAVAIDDGLITPIVRAANTKSLSQISREVRELATKAKTGTLKSEEFQGGSFTISNLGMFGVRQFDAIINPPQAAILAVAGGEQRPVVDKGELKVATMMTVSLSSDHRVIDGAVAAQFLKTLKRFVETPSLMLA